MHITQPVQKGYILCDSKYMTFRRSKTMWTTKRSFVGGERSEYPEHSGFLKAVKPHFVTKMMDTYLQNP